MHTTRKKRKTSKKKTGTAPSNSGTTFANQAQPAQANAKTHKCRHCTRGNKPNSTFLCVKPTVKHKAEDCRTQCFVHNDCPKVLNKKRKAVAKTATTQPTTTANVAPTTNAAPTTNTAPTTNVAASPGTGVLSPTLVPLVLPVPFVLPNTAPTPPLQAHCPYCHQEYDATTSQTLANMNKTDQHGGDVVCPTCSLREWCRRGLKHCLCETVQDSKFCPIASHHFDGPNMELIVAEHVINGICSWCRKDSKARVDKFRRRAAVQKTTLSDDQKSVHALLNFSELSLSTYPALTATSLHEVDEQQLYHVWNYALATMHRSNKHAPANTFRVLRDNADTMKVLAVEAKRYDIFGRIGTKETGARQFYRLYHYITLPSISNEILGNIDDSTGIINWAALRSKFKSSP